MEKERSTRRSASALLKDFLTLALGISDKAAGNVAGQIQKDGELATMKQHVRQIKGEGIERVNAGLTKIKKQLDDMKGDEQPEQEDDKSEKKGDKKEMSAEKKEKKEVKENFTFMSHLLNEFKVSVDAEDPQAAMAAVKQANRKGARRTGREDVLKAAENIKTASKEEGPQKNLKVQIAKQEKILAGLRDRLNRMTGAK